VDASGSIVFVAKSSEEATLLKAKYPYEREQVIKLSSQQLLVPGFVDTHVHAPQYSFTGTLTASYLDGGRRRVLHID